MAYRGKIRSYVRIEYNMKEGVGGKQQKFDKNEHVTLSGLQEREDWTYACWDLEDILKKSQLCFQRLISLKLICCTCFYTVCEYGTFNNKLLLKVFCPFFYLMFAFVLSYCFCAFC